MIHNIQNKWKRGVVYYQKGMWEADLDTLPLEKKMGTLFLQFLSLVKSGFKRTRCSLHAASLTFFSLMTLIPILAMTLAMARAFGGGDLAKEKINQQVNGWIAQMEAASIQTSATQSKTDTADKESDTVMEENARVEATRAFAAQIRTLSDNLLKQLDKISFGTLGGIGAVMLLWTVISMLGKVESSFNEVWEIEKARPLQRKIPDYLFTILILPFLMIASSTVPIVSQIIRFMDKTVGSNASSFAKQFFESGLLKNAVTVILFSLLFTFLFQFMPNTRVKRNAAFYGGVCTAVLFLFWLKICTMLQIGIANYSALYGGFAVLPILLMWVYTSWEIVMLGAVICHAIQNRQSFQIENRSSKISLRAKTLLAMNFCADAAKQAASDQGGPLSISDFSKAHGISPVLSKHLADRLCDGKILAEVANPPESYLLYRCGKSFPVSDLIIGALDEGTPPEKLAKLNLSPSIIRTNKQLDDLLRTHFNEPVATLNRSPKAEQKKD